MPPDSEAIRLALHQAVLPRAMSLFPALGGTQEAYEDFLDHLTDAMVTLQPNPDSPQPGADPSTRTAQTGAAIRLALHQAAMPYVMSLHSALGGRQEAYDDFLDDLADAMRTLQPAPAVTDGTPGDGTGYTAVTQL